MKKICSYEKCTGCGACAASCPKHCIHMQENEEGFLYPVIDESQCVDCHICENSCAAAGAHVSWSDIRDIKYYAAKNNDITIRLQSSSGGIFSLLAEYVINNHGSVYGAAFNERYEVEHIRIIHDGDIAKLRTSKYTQSRIGGCYALAKEDLDNGMMVLFTGTPCQIAGLRGYLKRDYDGLFCQDIMCHGVPSPKLWRKYLSELKSQGNIGEMTYISFRDKSESWSQFSMRIDGTKGNLLERFFQNDYMRAFLADIALRPSCSNCSCKELNYYSDVTLADFWGLDKAYPELDDSTGVSLVLVNTPKGSRLLDAIKDKAEIIPVDKDKALNGNIPAITNTPPHKNREQFMKHINDMSVRKLVKKNIQGNILQKAARKILKCK